MDILHLRPFLLLGVFFLYLLFRADDDDTPPKPPYKDSSTEGLYSNYL